MHKVSKYLPVLLYYITIRLGHVSRTTKPKRMTGWVLPIWQVVRCRLISTLFTLVSTVPRYISRKNCACTCCISNLHRSEAFLAFLPIKLPGSKSRNDDSCTSRAARLRSNTWAAGPISSLSTHPLDHLCLHLGLFAWFRSLLICRQLSVVRIISSFKAEDGTKD